MKKFKLFFALFAMLALGVGNAWGANCDYSDDFSTIDVNTSYSTRTTTAGWNATNTAVENYTYNSNSYRAFKINGKKGGLGKITSPLFSDGCSAISFVYGQAHKDAIKFDVKIYDKNNVELFSKSYSASKPDAAPTAGVLVEETITGVEGDFYVVFANTSTSTSTSNGYRVSIMNVCITSSGSGGEKPAVYLIPKTSDFSVVKITPFLRHFSTIFSFIFSAYLLPIFSLSSAAGQSPVRGSLTTRLALPSSW